MWYPPNDSPFWSLARAAVLSSVLVVLSSTLYKNGFSQQDIYLIVSGVAGVLGVDIAQGKATK